MNPADAFSVVAFVVICSATVAVVASRSRAWAPVVATFVAHMLIGWLIWDAAGYFTADASGYDSIAREYMAYWNGVVTSAPDFAVSKEGWVLVLASIYRLFGANPLLGITFNAAAAAVTTSLVMGTTARLGWESKAKVAGWLMLWPAFLLWSSLLLRESLAWMLAVMALWAGAGLTRRAKTVDAAWLVLAIVASLWIRGSLAAVMLVGILVGIVAARRRIPVPLMVLGVLVAVVGSPLVSRFASISGGVDVEQINSARQSLSTAGSGFTTSAYSTPSDILTSLPSTLPRAVFGPYPQELLALPQTAFADWFFWMLLLYLAWRGWRWSSGRGRWLVVAPAVAILIAIAATSGNYGTMVRLRATPAALLVPLAAAGLRSKPQKKVASPEPHRSGHVPARADRVVRAR